MIVAMAYLYISTTAFLFGAQLDAIIRAQATGTLSGVEVDRRTVASPAPHEPGFAAVRPGWAHEGGLDLPQPRR